MEKRSRDTLVRGTDVLCMSRTETGLVNIQEITQFIPETVLVVFDREIVKIDGLSTQSLSTNELELLKIVTVMGNNYKVYALAYGDHTNYLWTPQLRSVVLRYRQQNQSTPLEVIRKADCARRRDWFSKIKELFPH